MRKYTLIITDDYTDKYCGSVVLNGLTIMEVLRLIEQSTTNGYQVIVKEE